MSANRGVGENLDSGYTFKKQSNDQHDRQRDEGMQMKQRHRCVNREFNPPGQGTSPVAARVDRGCLAGIIALYRAGVIRLRQAYGGRAAFS